MSFEVEAARHDDGALSGTRITIGEPGDYWLQVEVDGDTVRATLAPASSIEPTGPGWDDRG